MFRMRGLAAAAFLAAFPIAASAQSDVIWTTAPRPESQIRPAAFRLHPVMPDFDRGGLIPYRPVLTFEESSGDRERRYESLMKCALLSETPARTILDSVAGVPNDVIDWMASGVRPAPGRCDTTSLGGPGEGSILSRVLSNSVGEASDRPFDDLVQQLIEREQRYFARFADSDLSTVGVGDGVEDINTEGLMSAQRKLLFDAARKLYFSRLGTRMDDRLRDESLDVARWHAVDYAVAPAMIAGFLYVRGWEKKFDLLGLDCGFQIEPLRRIFERLEGSHNDLVSAASLELGLNDFPVKVIVSAGIQDGDPLIDFVGIGTSVGKAKQIVGAEMEPDEPPHP